MAELYEVVIFTAAMQDVITLYILIIISMLTGYWIKSTKISTLPIDFTGSMHFLMDLYSSKI